MTNGKSIPTMITQVLTLISHSNGAKLTEPHCWCPALVVLEGLFGKLKDLQFGLPASVIRLA